MAIRTNQFLPCCHKKLFFLALSTFIHLYPPLLGWFVPAANAPPVAAVFDRRRCGGRRQKGEWSGSAVASLWRDKGLLLNRETAQVLRWPGISPRPPRPRRSHPPGCDAVVCLRASRWQFNHRF